MAEVEVTFGEQQPEMPTVTYKDEREEGKEEEDRLIRDNENIENSGYHHHRAAAAAAR